MEDKQTKNNPSIHPDMQITSPFYQAGSAVFQEFFQPLAVFGKGLLQL